MSDVCVQGEGTAQVGLGGRSKWTLDEGRHHGEEQRPDSGKKRVLFLSLVCYYFYRR